MSALGDSGWCPSRSVVVPENEVWGPANVLQAPLLCEMAAFVSSRHESGPDVADAFARMAASWASQYAAELRSLETQATDDAGSSRPDVQAKCALAHALVVITHGASSQSVCVPASTVKSHMSKQQAESLCFHMVQAARHSRSDCAPPLQQQLQASMRHCARVMACRLHTLDAMLAESADTLSYAARGVFAELPADTPWKPVSGAQSCYVTQFQGSTYSVNLLTGRSLRNGRVPGQLPSDVLEHPEYQRAFGLAIFEVTAETVGGDVLFTSARSIGGRLYSWMLQGQRLIVCEIPINPLTGQAIREAELELLPCMYPRVVPVLVLVVCLVLFLDHVVMMCGSTCWDTWIGGAQMLTTAFLSASCEGIALSELQSKAAQPLVHLTRSRPSCS